MSHRRGPRVPELKMDMTPLIDCVFLLILFFLLTTEITVQLEDVELPFALEGTVEESDPKSAPIILNVVLDKTNTEDPRSGKIIYGGVGVDEKELTRLLILEAQDHAQPPPRGRGNGWEIGPDGSELSKLSIIVRADRSVASSNLRTIFSACGSAKIYKVKVSTVPPGA